ncbi:MAG: permease [Thermotogae bacterium]|nr:permease [Thermotogota bacterium]
MKRDNVIRIMVISAYIVFIVFSLVIDFTPGKQIFKNFTAFSVDMLKVLPCAFILIGLFEVWVKKETVEKHFGRECGIKGYVWAILLAGTTVGGLYVAFPVAYSLYSKGAKLSVIFTYVGASAICRIPMTIYEASFMGMKFTLIRLLTSIPLVVVFSISLGNYLEKKNYEMKREK